jgi:hypothetical protein
MGPWIQQLVSDMFGWFLVVVGTLVAGFCAGYWIGHGEITGFERTMSRLLFVPFLWLGFRPMPLAYLVTWFAWYLPMRYDSNALRLTAAIANFFVWLFVVWFIVVRSAGDKFFAF